MRLLWLKSDYIIPPDTGGKIRTYNLLRELNRLCPVTYAAIKNTAAPNDEPAMQECAAEIVTVYRPEETKTGTGFYARVLAHVPSSVPYTAWKYRCAELKAFQREFLARGGDDVVVVCDFLDMAENVDWALPCPKVLFEHNVETMIWRRYAENETHGLKRAYFRYESRRMEAYEKRVCGASDLVMTVSENDRAILRDEFGVTRPVPVVVTGVDTDFFTPRPELQPESEKLVFTGSMDWMPNIDAMKTFVGETWPLIKAARPGATLDIVGRRPVPDVRALGAADPSIHVTGDVPDVRPWMAKGDLFIVPLRIGGGTRIKIYEAMAMKRPVVSTTIGAEGLPLEDGKEIVLADGPAAFAEAVCGLLDASDRRAALAEAGHALVTREYSWEKVARTFHEVCAGLLERPGPRGEGEAT
jgi:sugar transferase (PEP-CTERM/EpsH1 system associated)